MFPMTTALLADRCFSLKKKKKFEDCLWSLSGTKVHSVKLASKYQALYRSG